MPILIIFNGKTLFYEKRSIPCENSKLRDFLFFDYEVELWETYYPMWQENKDRIPESLRNLVQPTFNKEKSKLQQALQDMTKLLGDCSVKITSWIPSMII
jgi:hypothetical protein